MKEKTKKAIIQFVRGESGLNAMEYPHQVDEHINKALELAIFSALKKQEEEIAELKHTINKTEKAFDKSVEKGVEMLQSIKTDVMKEIDALIRVQELEGIPNLRCLKKITSKLFEENKGERR